MSKPSFVISCPINTYSGYGARSRDVVKALIELDKYEVKIIPQRWGNTPQGFNNLIYLLKLQSLMNFKLLENII